MNSEKIELLKPLLTGPTEDEVKAARAVIADHEDALKEQMRGSYVRCTSQFATGRGCGTLHKIGDLEYIQTHWYTEPYGCTGGDYWSAGEGQFECPACGHINRLYESPEIEALKPYFKSVLNTH